jgi:hypothetical protein
MENQPLAEALVSNDYRFFNRIWKSCIEKKEAKSVHGVGKWLGQYFSRPWDRKTRKPGSLLRPIVQEKENARLHVMVNVG